MKFDIHHAAAMQTVSATNGSLDTAEQDVSAVSSDCDALAAALGDSSLVSSAVDGLKQEVVVPTGEALLQHGRSATSNTSAALSLFSSGDQQMAQQSQSHESSISRPDAPGAN